MIIPGGKEGGGGVCGLKLFVPLHLAVAGPEPLEVLGDRRRVLAAGIAVGSGEEVLQLVDVVAQEHDGVEIVQLGGVAPSGVAAALEVLAGGQGKAELARRRLLSGRRHGAGATDW